ncbi:DNA binding domain-containing protein, excisionase family [Tindallia magadiensis]|uniref:DNA binding domain-containing protein, excisionase family n=1 Tax=Tindallia magadiensis TaxID=69895 RepID=A0A1I3HU70_9FIRM|nr:helix-turn-helix domain-containing protein [Tindallia magadiensis]SFI39107.1 DNA binding domain-containing protein, excisionase family [Tindallia magadiensis]
MENNKLMPLSIIILAISIVFGSIWIGNSLKEIEKQSIYADSQGNDVLALDEAAKYLKISEGDLLYLIREENLGIKYVQMNDQYIFSKEALHEWLQSGQIEVRR